MDYTVSVDLRSVLETCCGREENGGVTETWMIDELAHAGPEHLDAAFVAGYDRKQGHPDPAEDLAIFEAHGLDGASGSPEVIEGHPCPSPSPSPSPLPVSRAYSSR